MLEFLVSRFISRSTVAAFLALLILSVPAISNLAKPGFYTSHDGETHTARIAQYFSALSDGQFPPRFAGSFYNGYGSPIFVYIYPLPYLLGSVVHFLGPGFADSFKILMALSFIFSGFFTYLWLKELFDSRSAGLAGAIFYTWAPYRFSLIYVRASISEMLAYTFIPIALWGLTKLVISKKFTYVPMSAIAVAGILLSQNLVAIMTAPIIGLYVLILCALKRSARGIIYTSIAAIWAFLISSVTYLPTLFERNYIHFDEIIRVAFINHFVTLAQLIRSPWGYGFDLPGTVNDQMSFQIGLTHILVTAIALLVILYAGAAKLKFPKTRYILLPSGSQTVIIIYFLAIFFVSAFLTLDYKLNVSIWEKLRFLHNIDLPWRLIGITTLAASVLASFVVKTFKPKILFIILIALVLYANRNHVRINKQRFLSDDFFTNYSGTATQYSEFAPKWRITVKTPAEPVNDRKVEVYDGKGTVEITKSNSKITSAVVDVSSDKAKVLVNKFYFPGAVLKLNGNTISKDNYRISDSMSTDINARDKSGVPDLDLPRGKSTISYEYTETPLRVAADLLTLASLSAAIIFAVRLGRTKS